MAFGLGAWTMATGAGVTSITTSAIDTTGADLLMVGFSANGLSNWAASDSKSNTWAWNATNGGGYGAQKLGTSAPASVGTGHTCTVSHGGGTDYPTITFGAFSGMAASALDLSGNGSDGANSSGQSTGTLGQASELIVFLSAPLSGDADIAHTWQNGLSELAGSPVDWANFYPHAIGYKTVASTASTGLGLSWDEGQSGQDFVWATYKIASGVDATLSVTEAGDALSAAAFTIVLNDKYETAGTDEATTSTTVATTITGVTAGSTLVALVGAGSSAAVINSVSDGTAYAQAGSTLSDGTNNQIGGVFYRTNVEAGSHTITATFDASYPYRRIRVVELSAAFAGVYDAQASALDSTTAGLTDGLTSGNGTASGAGVILGFSQNTSQSKADSPGAWSAGTGFLLGPETRIVDFEVKKTDAGGTFAATFTAAQAISAFVHALAFKAASGGPVVRRLWRKSPRALGNGLFGSLARVDSSSVFPILARQQLFDDRTLSTSVTEAADALSSTASTSGGGVVANLSVTEANDALSAAATAAIAATLSATEAADVLASTATNAIVATLTRTEANDALSAAATNAIAATLSATEAADALSSTATVGSSGVDATLTVTEANDAVSSTATAAIAATLSATEPADALASTATNAIAATLTRTEADDALSAAATNAIAATLSATEPADALAATATAAIVATLSRTEADDALSSTVTTIAGGISATLSVTEANDAVSSTATNAIAATLSVVEAGDALSAGAGVQVVAAASFTEAGDGFTSTAGCQVAATLTRTEADDALSSTLSIPPFLVTATLAIVEESDSLVAFTGVTAGDPFFTVTGKRGRYAVAADGRGFVVTTDREFDSAATGRRFAASGGRRFTA